MNDIGDELAPSEREALEALRRDLEPPAALERNVLHDLEVRGLVRDGGRTGRRQWRWLQPVAAVAGAAALFAAGISVGGRSRGASPAAVAPARYVLFLEGEGEPPPEEEARHVQEYKAWARRLAATGRLVTGEKLAPENWHLGPSSAVPGGQAVVGFFLIAAGSDAEALEIARSCPHLTHGGRIVLRKVAPT